MNDDSPKLRIDPDTLQAIIGRTFLDKSFLRGGGFANQLQKKEVAKSDDPELKKYDVKQVSGDDKLAGSMVEKDLSGRFSGIFEGKKDVISNYQETKKQNDEKMKEHKNKLETFESRIDKLGSNSGLGTGGAASERSLQVLKVEKLEVSQMQGQNGQAFSGGDRNAGGMFSSSSREERPLHGSGMGMSGDGLMRAEYSQLAIMRPQTLGIDDNKFQEVTTRKLNDSEANEKAFQEYGKKQEHNVNTPNSDRNPLFDRADELKKTTDSQSVRNLGSHDSGIQFELTQRIGRSARVEKFADSIADKNENLNNANRKELIASTFSAGFGESQLPYVSEKNYTSGLGKADANEIGNVSSGFGSMGNPVESGYQSDSAIQTKGNLFPSLAMMEGLERSPNPLMATGERGDNMSGGIDNTQKSILEKMGRIDPYSENRDDAKQDELLFNLLSRDDSNDDSAYTEKTKNYGDQDYIGKSNLIEEPIGMSESAKEVYELQDKFFQNMIDLSKWAIEQTLELKDKLKSSGVL